MVTLDYALKEFTLGVYLNWLLRVCNPYCTLNVCIDGDDELSFVMKFDMIQKQQKEMNTWFLLKMLVPCETKR